MINLENNIETNEAGFTLLELMIVISLSSVLLIAMLNLFDWHQKIYLQEVAHVQTTNSARSALLSLSKNIAQANTVMTSRSFGGTTYTTDDNEIVLQLPSVNSNGEAIAVTYDYVAYYLDNGSLFMKLEANGSSIRTSVTKVIAENVQTFALGYNTLIPTSVSVVTIDIETVVTTRNNNVSTRLMDTIFLRNK